jgi:hypothetical protein
MSADITVFHSEEVDDRTLLLPGRYIGEVRGDTLTTDGAIGPYATEADAQRGICAGQWMLL